MRMERMSAMVWTFIKPVIPDVDVGLFIECMMKQGINFSAIMMEALAPVAHAIYLESSIFNHSCRPNASAVYIGTKQVIRAIASIPAGEQIFIPYMDLQEMRDDRRLRLKQRYFFDCECIRCLAGDEPGSETVIPQMKRLKEKQAVLMTGLNGMRHREDRAVRRLLVARQLFEANREYLQLHEQFFGFEYEIVQSFHMLEVLISAAAMRRTKSDTRYLRDLMSKARRHILVTHGSDHPVYERLLQAAVFLGPGITI